MSADNWRVCPNCLKKHKAKVAADLEAATASYGKVPADEYEAAIAAARKAKDEGSVETTFREDRSIGVYEDGEFYVDYRGCCIDCSAHFEFEYKLADALRPGERPRKRPLK